MDKQKEFLAIEKRQLTSVMNDTKWRKLGKAMEEILPYAPPYQIKYLLEDTLFPEELSEYDSFWVEWDEYYLYSIEWIRLRSKVLLYRGEIVDPSVYDMTDELISLLKKERIPFVQDKSVIQIFGYVQDTGIFEDKEPNDHV